MYSVGKMHCYWLLKQVVRKGTTGLWMVKLSVAVPSARILNVIVSEHVLYFFLGFSLPLSTAL
jgi:hypothetical protein